MEKHYTNGEITIDWKPDLCIHSTNCWKGLSAVFDPRKRPWIKMDGADTPAIRAAVARCPSGALSLRDHDSPAAVLVSEASAVDIQLLPNGPLQVIGHVNVINEQGESVIKSEKTFLCRCGSSANKPYCDGTHRKIEFRS